MPATPLLVATGNRHKTGEIRAILGGAFDVRDLTGVPHLTPAEENGKTFEANASLKALGIATQIEGLVLADDSGLEVDALGGAPGVWSARYAGPGATDAQNREKLLGALDGITERLARFRCVMVLARGKEILGVFAGAVEGKLLCEERGEGGFGYDPLFVPEGLDQSFAELSPGVKNELSHRARALEGVRRFFETAAF